MKKVIITIDHDPDTEDPCTYSWWRLVSFDPRNTNHESVERYRPPSAALRLKLKRGLAYLLDRYDHSGTVWSLHGEGLQCKWDTAVNCGILLWQGKASTLGEREYDARAQRARAFLLGYNAWENGFCYRYHVEDETGVEIDSCGGIIGFEQLESLLKEAVPEGAAVVYRGEGVSLGDCLPFKCFAKGG